MLWHLLIVHFRKLINFGFKFGCRLTLQHPAKKLTWLRAHLHLAYCASTFSVSRFLFSFFFFSARTNSNCTIDAHGFIVQELHSVYRASTFLVSLFFFFLSFSAHMNSNCTVHADGFTMKETKCTVHGTYNHFVQKKYIKNEYHGTIHSFKNYFATVFSSLRF